MNKVFRAILCAPLFVVLVMFWAILIPVALLFFAPLWGLLDLIEVTKGRRSMFVEIMGVVLLMPLTMMKELWK